MDIEVGFIQSFGTTYFLDIFCKFFGGHPKHIVDGYNTQQDIIIIRNSEGYTVIHFKNFTYTFLVVVYIEGNKTAIHQLTHEGIRCGKDDVSDADIIQEFAVFIDHINHINRFRIDTKTTDGLYYLADGIVLVHIHIVWVHEAAHAVFRIAQQFKCNFSFFGIQNFDEISYGSMGQFFQEVNPVIRRQFIEQFCCFKRRKFSYDLLLICQVKDFKNAGGPVDREMGNDLRLVIFILGNKLRHIADVLVIKEILNLQFVFSSNGFFKPLLQRYFVEIIHASSK